MSCCARWRDGCSSDCTTCQVAKESQRPTSHRYDDPWGSGWGTEKKEEEEEKKEKKKEED